MRILLDECVPAPIRKELKLHSVATVPEMGWPSRRNSELLRLMSQNGFEVLLTVDQNMRHQQNLAQFKLAVIVVIAVSNQLKSLLPAMQAIVATLATIQPGDVVEIKAGP